MESTFQSSYFVLILLGVITASLHFVCLYDAVLKHLQLYDILLEIFVVLACLIYMFLTNHLGQLVIDSGSKFFTQMYDTKWYTVSVPTQKLLLYVMQNSVKSYTFLVGGLFKPNYEGFYMLFKMSLSYFMVVFSTYS
ncbi:uncharacterized protein LOC143182669 [Calliopsis andreniformis]|uniref:uncharacterized protein LOC143182669 n=1 Tax=Calliopsis andreniformis TaxID=337506 RepID=UPI003FCC7EB1